VRRLTVLVVLLVGLAASLAGQARPAATAPSASERLRALDQAILAQLNAVRADHGLRPDAISADLQEAAVFHSRSMLDDGFFAHESKDGSSFVVRLKRFYSPGRHTVWSAGENLLYSGAEIDAEAAVKAWMASPPHRRNMLDPSWRDVGIGSMHSASAGGPFGGAATWVITVDFGFRKGAGAAATRSK
jgi:uncharacterized protein YkwD